jgi:hypothetical protein
LVVAGCQTPEGPFCVGVEAEPAESPFECGAEELVGGCGGDVVGSWEFVDTCVSEDGDELAIEVSGCDQPATARRAPLQVGTIRFNSDGTYDADWIAKAKEVATIPTACVDQTGCDTFSSQFSAGCVLDGETCTCTRILEDDDRFNASDRFEIVGNELSLFFDDADPALIPFCVDGDWLLWGDATLKRC